MFQMKQVKNKKEFSKIIVVILVILTFILTFYSMAAMLLLQDLSALPVIVTAVFGAFGTGMGFYYNKAKAENLKKLAKDAKEEQIEKEDIEKAKMLMGEEVNSSDEINY